MSEDMSVERLTGVYIKIRDARTALAAKFKAEDGELQEQLEQIKRALLDYCETNGLESARTTAGTFYRTVKTRYWTSDWESVYKFVIDQNMPELFEKRLNQTVLKELIEEDPDFALPGLNSDSEYVITVRKK
jgi:Zn/Cd-binding protein ZinT